MDRNLAEKSSIPSSQPRFDLSDLNSYFFTPLGEISAELSRRRKDTTLQRALRQDAHLMEFLSLAKMTTRSRAVLFRQIGTPTHEVLRFLGFAKQLKLKPLIFEYYEDKFVSAGNSYKRSLGKMPLYQHTGTDGRDIVKYHTIIDFNSSTGKKLSLIKTLTGKRLVDFHHHLLKRIGKVNPKMTCVDASKWLLGDGGAATDYYESFLTLFMRDAVLFESFEPKITVKDFFHKIVLPAFLNLERRYGYRPLIARLLPENDELRIFWDSFPKKTSTHL